MTPQEQCEVWRAEAARWEGEAAREADERRRWQAEAEKAREEVGGSVASDGMGEHGMVGSVLHETWSRLAVYYAMACMQCIPWEAARGVVEAAEFKKNCDENQKVETPVSEWGYAWGV